MTVNIFKLYLHFYFCFKNLLSFFICNFYRTRFLPANYTIYPWSTLHCKVALVERRRFVTNKDLIQIFRILYIFPHLLLFQILCSPHVSFFFPLLFISTPSLNQYSPEFSNYICITSSVFQKNDFHNYSDDILTPVGGSNKIAISVFIFFYISGNIFWVSLSTFLYVFCWIV